MLPSYDDFARIMSTFDGKCKGTFLQRTNKTSSTVINDSQKNDPFSNKIVLLNYKDKKMLNHDHQSFSHQKNIIHSQTHKNWRVVNLA